MKEWNSGTKDGSRTGQKEDSKALVTIDGEGVDWTNHLEYEDYALMACNSSDSDTEVISSSNKCKESYAYLKKLYDTQREQLSDASIEIKAYSQGLKKVEAQLVAHQQGQLCRSSKKKEDLKAKVEKWHNSSKNLSKLLNTQMSANDKFGLGYGDHRYDGILSYENEVLQSVFMNKESEIENQPLYDRFVTAEGMHVVPPPMTGNYMPSGPEIEVDYSQFTYGPKQTQPSESESQSSEFDTCESNISAEPSELVSEPVVNESNVECQPKVWSDAPIIEEYESDSEDEYVSIPTKQQETPSFANQQVKTPRENVKSQFTHSQKPKVDKKDLGHAWQEKLNLNIGWNMCITDALYSRKQNQFVPSAVLTRTGKIPVNTAKASSTKNFSTARQRFNRQTVLTSTAMKVNTVKPIVNRVRPANVFFKTHSPSSRPFKKTTVLRTDFSNQKLNTAKDYPHRALKNKGIVDSGCSRHMTGNKAYLAEFQDFNGGPVAFGGSKGYITGKGKIKTGKLDFEDVCFVKELQHFNLFSVSQICDKKNKVLFTDSECLVLSSEFKLPDENQVLLKIPRQNNMYSFNLENIVPSGGLACLIAKATTDESNKWHRRLGHVNFKNLLKLVKGNLNLRNKDVMNSVGQKVQEGIRNARTPQLNGVLRERTGPFIEAARWGFLVGYSPTNQGFLSIEFRNQKDVEKKPAHQNSLENKLNVAGKGPTWLFDLDYLTDSMNYHPVRSENQANHHAGQQEANQNAGTEDIIDARDSKIEDESAQDCFVLPIWPSYSSKITPIVQTDDKREGPREEEQVFMDELERLKRQEKEANKEAEALRKKFEQETENLVIQAGAAKASSTNIFSTVSTPAKASSTNLVNTVSIPVSTANPHEGLSLSDPTNPEEDDSEIPPLEDIYQNSTDGIFTTSSYDDEGAVADFTNLETVVNVSPIPTSRIHSSHPTALILGDPTSAVQTRSKLHHSSGAHAFVSYVQKQRRNNHKDFQHCLFACFLSQNEPKKISEALEDESWVDAMQEELLQFKIQKVWVLVDLPYGKKAIGTKWVYRNKKDERGVVVRNKARIEAIRIFLAFASYMGFIVYQMDVKSAFLYGKIDEEVYVSQPPGFLDPKYPQKVYKVVKALYGLHQAPRAWYATLSTFLLQNGYRRVQWESSFLSGIQVKQKADGSSLLVRIIKDEEASDVDVHLYRSMIGSLMYLTASRPDIMYLKGKPKLGLWYPRVSSFDLESYSDSDYAGANLDRKSTTGGCQFLGRRLVSWQCKKQTIGATSTTEADYVAAASCCGQVLWIQNQMLDYGFNFMNTKIYIDNESTICIVKNPVYHSKTKHIAIRHHFIRDAYEKKLIQVLKIHTDDNVADLLTKALTLISLFTTITLSTTMAVLDSCPKHNMVTYLEKSEGNAEFHEIIDFLKRNSIHHALTISPVVSTTFVEQFWTSAKSKIINNVRHITAKVAGKSVSISEASIRSDLLFDDADGIDSLPNQAIFDAIQLMGYEGDLTVLTFNKALFSPQWRFLFHTMNHCLSSKSTSWDQIPTNIATAVICLTSNQKYNFSKLIFDGMLRHLDAKKKFVMYPRFISIFLDKQLANVPVPLDHFPVNTLTSKVFSFMVKKGKHFSGKVTPLFASMLVQPTEDEGAPSERPSEAQPTPSPAPTSEVPHEPQTDSSPAHTSEVPIEQQTDLSPRPSPTPIIPDSIPETSCGNLGGHSSSDTSLSGNEERASPKKQRVHKESVSKQGRKFAKGEPSVQRDPLFDELPEDTVDHMETENAQDVGRTREIVDEEKEIDEDILSTEDVLSTDKEKVSTDRPIVSTDGSKVSTDRQVEGTDEQNEGTEEQIESTDGQRKGTEDHTEEGSATQATQTPTSTIFGDDETIAKVLLNMSQAKAVSREKEKGVELKDIEETDRPRPTSTRSLLTLKPLPKIDPKDKGKKKIEEEDESESESDGIPEAEKKFKQLESDEEMARKIQEEWEGEEERNRIAKEKATNEALIRNFNDIKARIEADRLLAERLQEQEREQFTIEERAKFLHDTIAAQRKFLAQQRSEAIRNRPPTKNQLRNQLRRIMPFFYFSL
ncbi:putative ribonuclease H-like domain-containing protein [Tanacetum coccineum]